jgi:hypothetical protein
VLICQSLIFQPKSGDEMASLNLSDTLKTLQGERANAQKELAKLDKAIAVLRELSGADSMPSPNGKRHTLSASGRRKIAKAQKARWAKVRVAQKAKA